MSKRCSTENKRTTTSLDTGDILALSKAQRKGLKNALSARILGLLTDQKGGGPDASGIIVNIADQIRKSGFAGIQDQHRNSGLENLGDRAKSAISVINLHKP